MEEAAPTHAFSITSIGVTMGNSLIPSNALITASPGEGRQLAIKMARLVIEPTPPDEAVRNTLRDVC